MHFKIADTPRLLVFTSRADLNPAASGSTIRIKGYTRGLADHGADFVFAAPVRPSYVQPEKYAAVSFRKRTKLLVKLTLIVWNWPLLGGMLRSRVLSDHGIHRLAQLAQGRLIWAHQEGPIPMFLNRQFGIPYLYDVHGILRLHTESLAGMTWRARLIFFVDRWLETRAFRHAAYVNATSEKMRDFIAAELGVDTRRILVAGDGLLEERDQSCEEQRESTLRATLGLDDRDRIVLFAGTFKKIGGPHLLVDVFCRLARTDDRLKLLMIGSGQMEPAIYGRLRKAGLLDRGRFIHVQSTDHSNLPFYQAIASVIVVPNMKNRFLEMIPNIKIFDTLASGRPAVISFFEVLTEIVPVDHPCVTWCKPSDPIDLERAIASTLDHPERFEPFDPALLRRFHYSTLAEAALAQLQAAHVACPPQRRRW